MLILRSFTLDDATTTDGRTVTLRAVPYGKPTIVRDVKDGKPTKPYREGWEKGAFRKLVRAAHRVPLVIGDHNQRRNPMSDVGKGLTFVERDDGLIATFRIDETPGGDQALFKIVDGQWTHASVGALVLRNRTEGDPYADGVLWRTQAHLDHVVLTDRPAYAEAEVLSLRDEAPGPLMARWLERYPLRPTG
jgi:HK97 family phage prohead protease